MGRKSGAFSDIGQFDSRPSQDAFTWMSADRVSKHSHTKDLASEIEAVPSEHEGDSLPPSYPLPLVFFVCLLSVIGGLVVTGVHYAILFAGCPLGLNGCNDFTPSKEKYGFFLIRALDDIPEDIIYIFMSLIGGLIFAQMCVRLPEHLAYQITGGGTLQGLVAVASGQRITLTAAGLRIIASCVYLGTGGTLGMDGPAIQVCTAVTTFCGWALGMRGVQTQSLLASLGFAAGFAASFNAPLAGVMFAIEELSHASPNMSQHIICIILMVSIVATGVARLFSGNKELLQAQWSADLMGDVAGGSLNKVFGADMWMLISIPIAIVCSLFGHLSSIIMRKLRIWTLRLQQRIPFTALIVLSAALASSIGSAVFRATGLRGVWGIGYESLQKVFDQEYTVSEYLIFAAGKMLATALALAVRAPGDLLEPVIIVGAFMGGAMARALQAVVDDDLEQRIMQPCLVFGMVAFFASCFRFPLTPVIIVLEVTGVDTYSLVLPAALAAFTAVTVSNRLYVPFLDHIMAEDGISLHDLSENAAALDAEEEDEEPEPESDGPSREPSCPPSESPSMISKTSHASSVRFQGVLRGMESSMLTLSHNSPPKGSRSSSRSNSRNSSWASANRGAYGDLKLHAMMAVNKARVSQRSQEGHYESSRSQSRNPSSGAQSIGCISLHVPASEQSYGKRGGRLNTNGSSASSCQSLNFLPVVTNRQTLDPKSRPCEEGGLHAVREVDDTTNPISCESIASVTRAELDAMRMGMLIRSANAMNVDADALDNAIEISKEAVIELILRKMSSMAEQTDTLKATTEPEALETRSPRETDSASSASRQASETRSPRLSASPKNPVEFLEDHGVQQTLPEAKPINQKPSVQTLLDTLETLAPRNNALAEEQQKKVPASLLSTVQIGQIMTVVTADEGICIGSVLEARLLKEWISIISAEKRINVSKIHLQSIEESGSRIKSIKFKADAEVDGKFVPGVVYMLGAVSTTLVLLYHEGRQYTVLVRKPRVPISLGSVVEIPTVSVGDGNNFVGVAVKHLKEEISLEIKESDLIDMTDLAYEGRYAGVFSSCEASDEFAKIFLLQKTVSVEELDQFNGKIKGVEIVPFETLWRNSPDAKALTAATLYSRLQKNGLIPNRLEHGDKHPDELI